MSDLWFSLKKMGFPSIEVNLDGTIRNLSNNCTIIYLDEDRVRFVSPARQKTYDKNEILTRCLPRAYWPENPQERKTTKRLSKNSNRKNLLQRPDIDFKKLSLEGRQECVMWLIEEYPGTLGHSGKQLLDAWIADPEQLSPHSRGYSTLSPQMIFTIYELASTQQKTNYQLSKIFCQPTNSITQITQGTRYTPLFYIWNYYRNEVGE